MMDYTQLTAETFPDAPTLEQANAALAVAERALERQTQECARLAQVRISLQNEIGAAIKTRRGLLERAFTEVAQGRTSASATFFHDAGLLATKIQEFTGALSFCAAFAENRAELREEELQIERETAQARAWEAEALSMRNAAVAAASAVAAADPGIGLSLHSSSSQRLLERASGLWATITTMKNDFKAKKAQKELEMASVAPNLFG